MSFVVRWPLLEAKDGACNTPVAAASPIAFSTCTKIWVYAGHRDTSKLTIVSAASQAKYNAPEKGLKVKPTNLYMIELVDQLALAATPPLLIACQEGHIPVVELLLASASVDLSG